MQKVAEKVDVWGFKGSVWKFFQADPALDHGQGSDKYLRPLFQNSREVMPPTAVYSGSSSIPSPVSNRRDHNLPQRISETGYLRHTAPYTYPCLLASHSFSNSVVDLPHSCGWIVRVQGTLFDCYVHKAAHFIRLLEFVLLNFFGIFPCSNGAQIDSQAICFRQY